MCSDTGLQESHRALIQNNLEEEDEKGRIPKDKVDISAETLAENR